VYIMSRNAGYGRNLWESVNDGRVHTYAGNRHITVTVQNGIAIERVIRTKDECTTLRYGQGLTAKKANKTVKEEYYEPGTLQAIRRGGLWKRETGIELGGSDGTVECYSTSSGAYGREVFKYRNGKTAYIASRWRKKLVVYRPNGKRWIVIEGRVHLDHTPIARRLSPGNGGTPLWGLMRGPDWKMTVYATDGKTVITQGQVKNRQKQGKWLEEGKVEYYISGVKVSRQLYEDDPGRWNASEVLRIPNAQLRCSLLNRMGYDKLLERINHRVVDESYDGGQLIEINTNVDEHYSGRPDRIMRLVKVICPSTGQVYVLRVPPGIENYEQARQWTFGLREQSISDGAQLDLVKET